MSGPKLVTRAQRDMALALELVREVEERFEDPSPEGTKGRYQALCQEFPVMVRAMGLCQAVAFSEAKKGDERGLPQAHALLLEHLSRLLDTQDLLKTLREAEALEYMHLTRRVLGAWVYFKRFSKSLLTVKASGG